MTLVTAEQLNSCAPSLTKERAAILAGLVNEICPKYGINTKDILHEFLANVIQESGEFQRISENLNYKSPDRLMKVFGVKRFPTIAHAMPFVRNPVGLANKVYGGRMGNDTANDGWTYRGAPFIGLTGKETITKYADYIKKSAAEAIELMRSSDYYALDSSCWFFSILKKLNDEADADLFVPIVKAINGGIIGIKDREHYYQLVKKHIV